MIRWCWLLALLPFGLWAQPKGKQQGFVAPGPKGMHYTLFVNPFIGTGGHGHTFPGATVPFGMVQLSPDTRLEGWDGCSGYHFTDSLLYGFSHTHLSGTGVGDYGDVLLMPFRGKANPDNGYKSGSGYRQVMDKKSEVAKPGFYQVRLPKLGVTASMTATERVGVHQYEFAPKSGQQGGLILDLMHRDEVLDASLRQISPTEWEGHRISKAWAKEQHVYFVLKFSAPVQRVEYFVDQEPVKAFPVVCTKQKAAFYFGEAGLRQPLKVRVAISSVSTEGARRNLLAEAPHENFFDYQRQADLKWEAELSKIQVNAGKPRDRRIFYTALYHCFTQPNLFSDVDGQYRSIDRSVKRSTDGPQYTVFSLWDTFRAWHPLMTMIDPVRTADFIRSFLRHFKDYGRLPVWELAGNETDCMIGYHAVPVIADAWAKGVRGFDGQLALEAMRASAETNLFGLESYRKNGCVFAGDESESVSKTLEYAYDDWCIAKMAESLGENAVAETYYKRAQSYQNLFDPSTGFFRAKNQHAWLKHFDPFEVNFNFTEANAWQYSTFVPQDISGLMKLHGGKQEFEAHLDRLFTAAPKTSGRDQADMTGFIGQYVHGNEPSHHKTWLYHYIGKPWKSQAYVNAVLDSLYHDAPDGLSGNEDCGQMSAWYVLSALGMYPVTPGSTTWVLGLPLFNFIKIKLPNGKVLSITGDRKTAYDAVGQLTVNGQSWEKSWVDHATLMEGGDWNYKAVDSKVAHATSWGLGKNMPEQSIANEYRMLALPTFTSRHTTFLDTLQIALSHPSPKAQLYLAEKPEDLFKPVSLYGGTRILKESDTLWAAAEEAGVRSAVARAMFKRSRKHWDISLRHPYSPSYAAEGPKSLIDDLTGGDDFRSGLFQGFQQHDLVATIDLKQAEAVKSMSIRCLQDAGSWVWLPVEVLFETSADGQTWTEVGKEASPIDLKEGSRKLHEFRAVASGAKVRYVRVTAKNLGRCPDWHLGAGGKAWIMADEIEVGW